MDVKELTTRDVLTAATENLLATARDLLASGAPLIPVAAVIGRTNACIIATFEDADEASAPMRMVGDRLRALTAAAQAQHVVLLFECWALDRPEPLPDGSLPRPSVHPERYDALVTIAMSRDGCRLSRCYRLERRGPGRVPVLVDERDTFESAIGDPFDAGACPPDLLRFAEHALSSAEAQRVLRTRPN